MTEGGRFTVAVMTAAMQQVADHLGVRSHDAHLLRLTNNAVFALPSAGIVIRIIRSHQLRDRVRKVVELGRWFEQVDAPTIRLAPGVAEPVQVGDVLASVWQYVSPSPPQPSVADLGLTLRAFHHLGPPPPFLLSWDPIGDARSRIADAEGLDDQDQAFLLDWCERLEAPVTALRQQAQDQLIHGDAHAGNLLRDQTGRVLFCDFDATCLGPREVDLTAVAVGEVRFGRQGVHQALVRSYGYDVTADPNWWLLRETRELKMVVAAVPLLNSTTGARAEFKTRLGSIEAADWDARWTPFAEVGQPKRPEGD